MDSVIRFLLHVIILLSYSPRSSSEALSVANYSFVPKNSPSRPEIFVEHLVRNQFQNCELVLLNDNSEPFNSERIAYFSSGIHQVMVGVNITFPRHEDIHKYTKRHCSLAILTFEDFNSEMETWLTESIIPRYAPIIRKDVDHFVIVSSSKVSDNILSSPHFGKKVKFKLAVEEIGEEIICKTEDLYGHNGVGELKILRRYNAESLDKGHLDTSNLFPDMTKKFNGKVFRFAIPKVPFRIEIEKRKDGRYHPKRGFYKWWLDEVMSKYNFTYHMFPASFGGGTGKRLKNGTWVGAVGDVLYERADISTVVAEIYSRHEFLSWSHPLSYEWVIFLTHPPRKSYSAKAIFNPFTPLVWTLFFSSILLMTFTLKNVTYPGFNLGSVDWSYLRIFCYVISTFLEQDRVGPFKASSERTLCAFWLLFAMVTATAYRGKLVSLIAFPVNTFVPTTFEELANSNFKVALNVVGKAGAAYDLFSSSTSPIIETIFKRMELIPEPEICLQRGMDEDFACVIWQSYGEYASFKNLTDKYGRVPLIESTNNAMFIIDGLVYERRAIFGYYWDITIKNAEQMGLTMKWIELDQEFIRRERKIWEEMEHIPQKVYDYDNGGPKKLVVSQLSGLFLLCMVTLLASIVIFWLEIFTFSLEIVVCWLETFWYQNQHLLQLRRRK